VGSAGKNCQSGGAGGRGENMFPPYYGRNFKVFTRPIVVTIFVSPP
jgi:hypothetical protein